MDGCTWAGEKIWREIRYSQRKQHVQDGQIYNKDKKAHLTSTSVTCEIWSLSRSQVLKFRAFCLLCLKTQAVWEKFNLHSSFANSFVMIKINSMYAAEGNFFERSMPNLYRLRVPRRKRWYRISADTQGCGISISIGHEKMVSSPP